MATDLVAPLDTRGLTLDAARIAEMARARGHILGTLSLEQIDRLAVVMDNNVRIMPTAEFGRFDGDILLYVGARATPGLHGPAKKPEGWRPYCRGNIHAVVIDEAHNRMMSPEALKQVGQWPFRGGMAKAPPVGDPGARNDGTRKERAWVS